MRQGSVGSKGLGIKASAGEWPMLIDLFDMGVLGIKAEMHLGLKRPAAGHWLRTMICKFIHALLVLKRRKSGNFTKWRIVL